MTDMLKYAVSSIILLWIISLQLVKLTSGEKDEFVTETDILIRQKRNLLCYLGINQVLESVLYDSIKDLQDKDPIKLGNSSNGKLQDGVLQGLSSLTNVSDLIIDCDEDGLIFRTTLGLENAVVHYKWRRKYLVNFDGTIWSRVEKVNFDIEVRLNFTGGIRFDVENITVTKLEGFRFGFSGLGPLNPLVKGFVKMMDKVWSTKIAKVIQKLLKKALEKQLNKLTVFF